MAARTAGARAAYGDGPHLAELLDGDEDQGERDPDVCVPPCIIVHWEGSGTRAMTSLSARGWDVRGHDLSAPEGALTVLRRGLGPVALCGVAVPAKRLTLTVHKLLAGALSAGDVVVMGRPMLPRKYRVLGPDYRNAGIRLVATLCGAKRNLLAGPDAAETGAPDLLSRIRMLACALTPREAWPSELEDFMGEPNFPRVKDAVPPERVQ